MLTAKQEAFCRNIVEGCKQIDAYKRAYNAEKMTDNSIYCEASKLMDNPNIAQRIAELRAEIAKDGVMTAQERAKWLTDVIASFENTMPDKLKALDILNKMTGEYVTKVDAAVNADVEVNVTLVDD